MSLGRLYFVGYRVGYRLAKRHTPLSRCTISFRGKCTKSRNDDNDDVIEAEIVGEKKSASTEQKSGIFDDALIEAGSFVGGLIRKTKEFLKMDEASIKKREQQKMVDKAVDQTLQGTGLFGTIIGSFVKQGLKIATAAAAENASDIQAIQESVAFILMSDSKVIQIVGTDPQCSPPYAVSSMANMSNSVKQKSYQLGFHVTGSKNVPAMASADATVDGSGDIVIRRVHVRKPDGTIINVNCELPSSKRKRTVIDV
jgi:hypothetical protein